MKTLMFYLCTLWAASLMAEDKVYLSNCYNYISDNDPVSFSYESCVNRNFRTSGREMNGLYLSTCINFDRNEVSSSFTYCINSNFSSIALNLKDRPYLLNCYNFSPKRLDISFINCVNRNFKIVGRALKKKSRLRIF